MTSRRHFLLGGLCLPAAAKKAAPDRPHVVVMLTSGVGAWMPGCYGNREIRTPNIDRLAQAGTRFAYSFTTAGTAPEGRAALLDGVAAALGQAGYTCGAATQGAEACRWLEQPAGDKPFFLTVDLPLAMPVPGVPGAKSIYDQTKFDSVNYEPVARTAAANREMFGNTVASLRRAAAAVSAMDEQVAPVLDCLRRRGFVDNTLVVFTSTCGALLGRHGLWGDATASDPPNLYDEVVAVPMIWSWPSRVPPAGVRPELVGSRDFLPTLCELSAAALPSGAAGRSYLSLARNLPLPRKEPWRNLVFARAGNTSMVRDNRYKLVVRSQAGGTNELFDLAADGREKTNQYDNPQFVTVRSRLQALLK